MRKLDKIILGQLHEPRTLLFFLNAKHLLYLKLDIKEVNDCLQMLIEREKVKKIEENRVYVEYLKF